MPVKRPKADFPVPNEKGRGPRNIVFGGERIKTSATRVPSTVYGGQTPDFRGGGATPIDRRDIGIIRNKNDSWQGYPTLGRMQVNVAAPLPRPPVIPRPVSTDAGRVYRDNQLPNEVDMPTFSDVILQGATGYFNAKYGGITPVNVGVGMQPASANVLSVLGSTPVGYVDDFQAATGQRADLCEAGCNSPRYLTYDCRTGEFKKKRRRRRRSMLTMSDRDTLTFISGLSSNANVKAALSSRISRS